MAFLLEIDDRLARILTELDQGGEIGTIALEELTVLAEAGDKSAIECLAFHLSGELLATDESIKWLLLANEFESADAAWQLAMIERQRSNLEEMKRWIDRSALLGQEDAIAVQKNGYDVQAVLATW